MDRKVYQSEADIYKLSNVAAEILDPKVLILTIGLAWFTDNGKVFKKLFFKVVLFSFGWY